MTRQIRISYFPTALKYAAAVIIIIAFVLLYKGFFIWGIIAVIVAVIVLKTDYVTDIDLKDRCITDFISVVGYPVGKEEIRFNQVDKVIITKGDFAQKRHPATQDRQRNWVDFTASLLFDNGQMFDLLTRTDKKKLIIGILEYIKLFQVPVEDHTTDSPYIIDLKKVFEEDN